MTGATGDGTTASRNAAAERERLLAEAQAARAEADAARSAAEAAEERYRLATEAVAGYVYDVDVPTGRVVRSAGFEALTGYAPDAPGRPEAWWLTRIHPEDFARLGLDAPAWLADPACATVALEYRVRHADGRWVWLADRQRIVRDAAGRPVRLVGAVSDVTARHEAEAAERAARERAEASEAALRLAQAAANVGTWRVDLADGVPTAVHWSDQYYRLHGLDPRRDPPSQGAWAASIHPEDRARVLALVADALADPGRRYRDGYGVEYRIVRPDGGVRWILGRGRVERDPVTDAPVRIAGANVDVTDRVTERAEAEAALRASETRFRTAVEQLPDVLVLYDAERRVSYVNPRGVLASGRPLDQLVGRRDEELFPPEVTRGYLGALGRAFATGAVQAAEYTLPAWLGGGTHAVTYAPFVDDAGQVVGAVAVSREVTAREQALAALDESERRFRAVHEASPDAVLLLGAARDATPPGAGEAPGAGRAATPAAVPDFELRYANPATRRLPGVPAAAAADGEALRPGTRLTRPALAGCAAFGPALRAAYARVVDTGVPYVDEVRLDAPADAGVRRGDGGPGSEPDAGATYRVTAVRTARDEVAVTLSDVSARAAALRAAQAANRAKSDFLATMSHELRTPLNAIQGHVQLLELGLHGPVTDAQRDALGRVGHAQRRLLGLINDVLNYAKLEAGRVEYDVRPTRLAEVVGDVVPLVEPLLAAKRLALTVALDPPAPAGADPLAVWADRDKLGQVLLNLLSNAVKFTPAVQGDGAPAPGAPGQVFVELAARPDAPELVELRVRDTGVGIPASKQAAVFEPFVQVQSGFTRTAEGTGLGLAISRDLARAMGGDLAVESAPGAGATFAVTLRRVVDARGRPVDRRGGTSRRDGEEPRSGVERRRPALDGGAPRPDA